MPRGDKSKYTDKQVRQAEHIEQGYEARGVPKDEAERRAWATENKISGGGRKPGGSGRGKAENHKPMKKGGRATAKKTTAKKPAAKRPAAKKAAKKPAERKATATK